MLRGSTKYEVDAFQVLNCRGTAKVKEISPHTDVPSAISFSGSDMGERVLDRGSFSQQGSTGFGLLQFAELLLSAFVDSN